MPNTTTPQLRRKRRTRRRRGRLNTAEASLGIYLDFEGLTDARPVLAGVLVPSETPAEDVIQFVVDGRFTTIGAATGLTAHGLEELMLSLVERAEREQRRIIAWSEHELDVVREWCSEATSTRFAARFRNARAVAYKWRSGSYPELDLSRPDRHENALANYLELIDYPVPQHVGYGTAATNIRRLVGPAAADREWASLSENQQQYWDDLLVHNQHDCIGMYRVSLRATEELAKSARPQQRN